jgi:hypothetical protein
MEYEMPWGFFCKANRRAFPGGCRVETDPKTVCMNRNLIADCGSGACDCDLITYHVEPNTRAPIPICIPP